MLKKKTRQGSFVDTDYICERIPSATGVIIYEKSTENKVLGKYLDSVGKGGGQNPENALFLRGKGGNEGVLNSKNLNLYAYCGQNPMIYIDSDGLSYGEIEVNGGEFILVEGAIGWGDEGLNIRVGIGFGLLTPIGIAVVYSPDDQALTSFYQQTALGFILGGSGMVSLGSDEVDASVAGGLMSPSLSATWGGNLTIGKDIIEKVIGELHDAMIRATSDPGYKLDNVEGNE